MIDVLRRDERPQPNVWKGLAAGAIAGAVGGFAMNQFQRLFSKVVGDEEYSEQAHSPKQSGRREAILRGQESETGEDAPGAVKAADAISEEVFGRELTGSEKEVAGPIVHYGFSIATGAMYGAATEIMPEATAGAGIPFSLAVWIIADQTLLPLLGLSKPASSYAIKKHAYSLASHFVYGAATEATRRVLRKMMGSEK